MGGADRGESVLTHRAEPCHAFSETVHRYHLTLGNMPFWEHQRPGSNAWNLGMGNSPKTPLPRVAQSNA